MSYCILRVLKSKTLIRIYGIQTAARRHHNGDYWVKYYNLMFYIVIREVMVKISIENTIYKRQYCRFPEQEFSGKFYQYLHRSTGFT